MYPNSVLPTLYYDGRDLVPAASRRAMTVAERWEAVVRGTFFPQTQCDGVALLDTESEFGFESGIYRLCEFGRQLVIYNELVGGSVVLDVRLLNSPSQGLVLRTLHDEAPSNTRNGFTLLRRGSLAGVSVLSTQTYQL